MTGDIVLLDHSDGRALAWADDFSGPLKRVKGSWEPGAFALSDMSDNFSLITDPKDLFLFLREAKEASLELAKKFEVMSIPNFILFKKGKVIERFIGVMPVEDFEEKLKKHL